MSSRIVAEQASTELFDFLKKQFGTLYDKNRGLFDNMVKKMNDMGVYGPEDLQDLEDSDLDSFELPQAQKNKLRRLKREQQSSKQKTSRQHPRNDTSGIPKDVKNFSALVVNNSSDPNSQSKVKVGKNAVINTTVGDVGESKRKGVNFAAGAVGNVNMEIEGTINENVGDRDVAKSEYEVTKKQEKVFNETGKSSAANPSLQDYLKDYLGSLHSNKPNLFNDLMKNLEENMIYEVGDLKYLDEDTLDSFELKGVQRKKLEDLIKQQRGTANGTNETDEEKKIGNEVDKNQHQIMNA